MSTVVWGGGELLRNTNLNNILESQNFDLSDISRDNNKRIHHSPYGKLQNHIGSIFESNSYYPPPHFWYLKGPLGTIQEGL